uniref:Uncharacterized protein n=1 Tax=Rhizophora mucronata TaxID=61149 RepID=A0A2P2QIT1_RHIMU
MLLPKLKKLSQLKEPNNEDL